MTKTRKVLYTITASFVLGAITGILYAPDEGVETRRKINRLRYRLGLSGDEQVEDLDKETLQKLRGILQRQLTKIDTALEAV